MGNDGRVGCVHGLRAGLHESDCGKEGIGRRVGHRILQCGRLRKFRFFAPLGGRKACEGRYAFGI